MPRPGQYLACAQPYYLGSHAQLFGLRPYWGSPVRHNRRVNEWEKLSCIAEASAKRQLHRTHVGAVGGEPHGSSPKTCAGKADQELP